MSSCLSLNSMPISVSGLWIMSFVVRPGVGDGRGEGRGGGVGVWAIAFNGRFATVNPAAAAAGRSLTKVRRLIEVGFDFFIETSLVDLISECRCPCSQTVPEGRDVYRPLRIRASQAPEERNVRRARANISLLRS